MARIGSALLAAFLLLPAGVRAADGPAGSWKFTLPRSNLNLLIRLEEKSGKWSAQFLGSNVADLPKVTFAEVAVTPDSLRLEFKITGLAEFQFDGKLPADPKTGRILGSLLIRGKELLLSQLEPSKLKEFDKFEFNKETLDQSTDAMALLDAALDLAAQAGEKKAKVEDVRGWADKAFKAGDPYGGRWQRTVALRLAQGVAGQKEYAPVAVEYARKAERLLDPDDDPAVQMETLEAVAQVLTKADKADDAKQITARLAKLEERDYADYVKKLPFKPDVYAGRKSKSDRAVLVELFTNSSAEQCIAAEVALAGLEKTYKPTEVVLLQYHLHLREQAPDPLGTPDALERAALLREEVSRPAGPVRERQGRSARRRSPPGGAQEILRISRIDRRATRKRCRGEAAIDRDDQRERHRHQGDVVGRSAHRRGCSPAFRAGGKPRALRRRQRPAPPPRRGPAPCRAAPKAWP